MTRQFKKWFADMLRSKQLRFVSVGKQIRVSYNGQILTKEDINFLFDVHRKNKARN